MTVDRTTDAIPPLAAATFRAWDDAGIAWCVLRAPDAGDIDVLVDRAGWARAKALAEERGFVALAAWGRGVHRMLVAYDAGADRPVRLDVVLDLRFGRGGHRVGSADAVLGRRRHVEDRWEPSDGDAAWALAAHLALDDGADVAERWPELRERAIAAGRAAAPRAVAGLVTAAASDDRAVFERLALEARRDLDRRHPVAAALRPRADRIARLATRALRLRSRGTTVALLGPDGVGKTSVVEGLRDRLPLPVASMYMGMRRASGEQGRILPLPGRIVRAWGRASRAAVHRARGRIVVFDRYALDAALPAARAQSRARRLGRAALSRAVPDPDTVVVLDAPAHILSSRRSDQDETELERRRTAYRALASERGFRVVDASGPLEQVQRATAAAIWAAYRSRARSR